VNDRREPGPGVAPRVQLIDRSVHLDEHVLGQILGRGTLAEQPVRERVGRREVVLEERLECLGIALPRPLERRPWQGLDAGFGACALRTGYGRRRHV
jgi:hypothetical protein